MSAASPTSLPPRVLELGGGGGNLPPPARRVRPNTPAGRELKEGFVMTSDELSKTFFNFTQGAEIKRGRTDPIHLGTWRKIGP